MLRHLVEKTLGQQVVAWLNLIGGLLGVIFLLGDLDGSSLNLVGVVAYTFLIGQAIAAAYGGYMYTKLEPVGAQVLYWVSLSSIPVITISGLTYYAGLGAAAFATISVGWASGVHFNFHLGHEAMLWLNDGAAGVTFGINVIAIVYVVSIKRQVKNMELKWWPIAWKHVALAGKDIHVITAGAAGAAGAASATGGNHDN